VAGVNLSAAKDFMETETHKMHGHTIRSGLLALALLGVTAFAAPLHAQQQDYSKVEIRTSKIAENFYTLDGQGGTISVLTGPDGILVVDSQFAPLSEKLVAAIRAVSDKPIRFLVNTHIHGDHTGGNANFAKLGAAILGRDQVRARLAHPNPPASGAPGNPAPGAALPVVTYDGPVTLHLNGETVHLIPLRNAHTDGDTLVQFAEHDILAVGDFFRTVGYPIVDLNNGGSLRGLLDALGATIALAGPATKIIPGHGAVADRTALVAHRDLLLAVRDKVAGLVAQGKSLEEVIAAKPTADFDAKVPQAAQSAERFVKWLYTEVKVKT
jgi:glyoxylase-like metal-dependent hydrolase (beta-lactamase superfamily II)